MGSLFIRNARLVLPPGDEYRGDQLLISHGIIATIDEAQPTTSFEMVDCDGDFLIPGLIDLHVHGAQGRDAMEATPDAFSVILNSLARSGTTTALLSTVSARREEILRVLEASGPDRFSPDALAGGARYEGLHLEGPYFSPFMRGAHRSETLRSPSPEETALLLTHRGVIRRVTLAPEIPGALTLTRKLTSAGITVSAGHSNATEEEAVAGFSSGISQATHLYNCMSSLRKEGGLRHAGLAEVAMTTEGILCELIADGIHLPPLLLRLAWMAKGWEGIALVSDATAGAGLADGEIFDLGGMPCRVDNGAAWTNWAAREEEEPRLAGSTSSLLQGVRMMVEKAGVPLAEAVAMASLVPARSLGISGDRGSLEAGKLADIVRLSPDWEIKGVWIGGRKVAG